MSIDAWARVDSTKIWHALIDKADAIISDAAAAGFNFVVTQGFRTWEEQDRLFAQVPKVTNAKGGDSAHNYGIAVDLYCTSGVPWAPQSYKILQHLAALRGLVWGGDWKHPDLPHIQVAGYVTGGELAPMKQLWLESPGTDADRLRRVWGHLEHL